ncbi:hypothetical protein JRO89_XS07G0087300 [Xanthoceras sorbifolium]|uniref:Uncharacterized protein n=1 Tax=Xanthoceras sorbifolium TaxID=99658 RepID=A0ABQ8HT18_9ROSI|nr:hypothetical protein JRO89_XS07G0087300 [Xanthoceras sorbifolium]
MMTWLAANKAESANKQQRKEQERLASAEARARAAEAAQKRQEQFEKSAAGKAARAQMQGMAKQSANSNKGEPVLKFDLLFVYAVDAVANDLKVVLVVCLSTTVYHKISVSGVTIDSIAFSALPKSEWLISPEPL